MRVFLAGATGVIGRPLTRLLVEGGHEVTGMTRSEAKVDLLREAGAVPVVCDALWRDELREAVASASPEVVIHQLTDIPAVIEPRKMEEQFAGNDRLRTEGTRNLVDAAIAAGARRIVAQSIAFAYAPEGGPVKSEDDPLWLGAPHPWGRSVAAVDSLEGAATRTEGIEGVVLRFGYFYGPGSAYAPDGAIAAAVKRRRFPVVGRGTGIFSFVHVHDAAAATLAAVEGGASGIYNVADDDPAPASEWLPAYAAALGAKRPSRAPKLIARLVAGPHAAYLMTEQRGASNDRAKRELDWTPRWASWREGFREALA
jgi:nucleoside-diphosphate-sugar epimerase